MYKKIKGAKSRGRQYLITDLTGKKFSSLTVVKLSHKDPNSDSIYVWECICDCGKKTYVRAGALKSGRIKSCGHLSGIKNTDLPLYKIWTSLKQRCLNPKNVAWKRYGGRGIKVCPKWANSFMSFYNYCKDLYIPGYSIDRIDNDGNYEPGNIRWVTAKESARNRSVTKLTYESVLEIRSSKKTHKELAIKYGVSKSTIAGLRCKSNNQWNSL